jgi:alkylated DNA repair protein (DNA oxidative demethylase)
MNGSGMNEPAMRLRLGPDAWLLRGYAAAQAPALLAALQAVLDRAPLRIMVTPGGQSMSVAMSNCGTLGWTSDRRGYRYRATDPLDDRPWPAMPPAFERLARDAAVEARFDGFQPDACLINRYLPGTRLSLHQDRDERDLRYPIVSVSLGLPAVFLFGGMARSDRPRRVLLEHADVVVWGGEDRLRFHGVMPLKEPQVALFAASGGSEHELLRGCRINLTFRKAG